MMLSVFSDQITLGNLLTVVGGLVAVAVAWGMIKAEHAALRSIVESHGKKLDEIEKDGCLLGQRERTTWHEMMKDHEERIRRLEMAVGKMEVMANDIHYIRRSLDDLKQRTRQKEPDE